MQIHRSLLAAAMLVSGVALAQSTSTPSSPSSRTAPDPNSTGSTTVPPGPSGTDPRTGASPGAPAMTPPVSSSEGTTPSPAMVLADLHMANQSEVDLGKLAEQKAQNKEVKKFGKHMVKAHTAMDKDAQKWAKKNHVTIPPPPQDPSHQAEMQKMQETKQKLEGMTGAEFDRTYMQAMAEDHATDLQKVTTFEQQATDKSFKKLLDSARKEIASHKKDADKLVQKLGSTAAR